MIYTRNKQSYKKKTVKVQQNETRKNILTLIKQTINRADSHMPIDHKNDQNTQSKNIQKKGIKHPHKINEFTIENQNLQPFQKNKLFSRAEIIPKVCESLYNTPQQDKSFATVQHNIPRHLKIHQQLNMQIVGAQASSPSDQKLSRAHKQYAQLLQSKLSSTEKEYKRIYDEHKRIEKQYHKIKEAQKHKQLLLDVCYQKFYHDARTNIILLTAELIQCRNNLSNNLSNKVNFSPQRQRNSSPTKKQSQSNINSIKIILGKSQQLLTVYRKLVNKIQKSDQNSVSQSQIKQTNAQFSIRKLEQTCRYQQKTIQFLRKQNKQDLQINEVRLLRHEINRISSENQKLISKIKSININSPTNKHKQSPKPTAKRSHKQSPTSVSAPQVSDNKISVHDNQQCTQAVAQGINNIKLDQIVSLLQFNNKQQQQQLIEVSMRYKQQQDKCYKYKQQKQCLIEFLQDERTKNKELLRKIDNLNIQIIELSQQNLKCKRMSPVRQLNFPSGQKQIASAEQLCKQLKPYRRYFNLFMQIITNYEQKISSLQQKLCEQKLVKDKFIQWSSSVYQLLAEVSSSTECVITADKMSKHMQQLYTLDRKIDNSLIDKHLRHIRAYSVGISEKQVHQMQQQLKEYVATLKIRNQVITEVDYQDGSSVALSDTFTDRDFDEEDMHVNSNML